MLIYLIRHGQTSWNAEARLQGQKDIPLNETGCGQATGNGLALGRLIGDRVGTFDFVSSPLTRTRQTMERIRVAMGLPAEGYRTDDRLKEVSFGDWEGSTMEELVIANPERVRERESAKWDFIPPGEDAESYEILSWRVGSWLQSVTQPTVCVAHGGIIRTIFKLTGALSKDAAAMAEMHQDRILEINGDSVRWI